MFLTLRTVESRTYAGFISLREDIYSSLGYRWFASRLQALPVG